MIKNKGRADALGGLIFVDENADGYYNKYNSVLFVYHLRARIGQTNKNIHKICKECWKKLKFSVCYK